MVRVLASRSSGPGSSPDRGHCVAFFSLSISLSGCTKLYQRINAEGSPVMDLHPIQGGDEILLVASGDYVLA